MAAPTHSYGLDTADLKALSTPSTLQFMLAAEVDLFACAVKAAGTPIKVAFPLLTAPYEKLLRQAASRLSLAVEALAEKKGFVLSGKATLPLLRYIDYLPGKLHMDEVFPRLYGKPLSDQPPKLASAQEEGFMCFEAAAIHYPTYVGDSAPAEIGGQMGQYLLLEMGLQLATHSHLVHFEVRHQKDFDRAIRKFQGFSGWTKFDLRWENEQEKTDGVLVFPSVADAVELLEAFEDEDESNEENRLPFVLEPISPCMAVPYMEDTQVKKLRQNHFSAAVKYWETPGPASRDRYTVMVSNFSERVSITELMKLFDDDMVVDATLYVDQSPHRRRRLWVHLKDLDSCRAVLDMDARHFHGAPLRILVAPPYVNSSRCGIELSTYTGAAKPPAPLPEPNLSKSPLIGSKGMNIEAKAFVPKFLQGTSPATGPAPPPPAYEDVQGPPSYDIVGGNLPSYDEAAKPPPPYTPSPGAGPAIPPPYQPNPSVGSPPAYSATSPPAYTATPNNSFADGAGGGSFGGPSCGPPPIFLPPSQ